MSKEKSKTELHRRMYGGLAILVVAILVASSIMALPLITKGLGLDGGQGSSGDTETEQSAGADDTPAEQTEGESPGLYPVDDTTISIPDDSGMEVPDGPIVEHPVDGGLYINPEKGLYVTPKEYDTDGMRRVTPGTLDWKYDTDEQEEISTPGLVDLNGDGTHEVVFASHGDAIYALSASGQKRWVNTENVIEQADDGHFGNLDFEPPPIFSSVTPADIDGSSAPEILVGVKDGIVCLNADGSIHWKKGLTTGYYFSTPVVTDLWGRYTDDKDDYQVVLGSDGTDRNAYLEAFHVDGGSIFRETVTSSGEPALLACSPVSQDLDGSFYDPEDDPPEEDEEVWHELQVGSHDHGMRIFAYGGLQGGTGEPDYNEVTPPNLAGHQTYATSAIGNFTQNNNNPPEEYEIIVGSAEGYQTTWESWGGTVYSYDMDGQLLWSLSTGGARAAIMSSIAVADVQMAELDENEEEIQYEIFFGCDSGKFYCLDADYRQELWSYTTGGRLMSSPAIGNLDSDDELEVVVGSNDGYVYCFDGDPSDMIDEGLADSGGASGAYDILWKYNTGGQGIGIASPVIGDIDNDNVLEVIVGDIGGTVYCIEAGSCSRGQMDWPMFHYDLNKTGFYNPNIQFGVDLMPKLFDDGPDSMVKSVQPGESVYYNITVKNTGSGVGTAALDTFYISLSEPPKDGWNAEVISGLSQDTKGEYYTTLEVDQTQDFVIQVSAPFEGLMGEVAQFNVTANSTNDPFIKDELQTQTQLIIELDMVVEFTKPMAVINDPTNPWNGEKWAKVDPGGEYIATVELKNMGNLNDTYDMWMIGIPEGWDVYFMDSQTTSYRTDLTADIFGGTGYFETIQISVNVPFDAQAGESATLVVKAQSMMSIDLLTPGDDSDLIEAQDYCVIEAGATNDLQLEVLEPLMFVDPGGTGEFLLYVTNRGNRQMTVDIEEQGLEGRDDEDDWEVDFEDEMFIADGQKKELRVYVTAPYDARAEVRLTLTISAMDAENPNIFKTVDITTVVKHMYRINATIAPEMGKANPGDTISYRLVVENEGNGEDVIKPSPDSIIKGWDVWFTPLGKGHQESQSEFPLGYNEVINISVKLLVPEETLKGDYNTVVNVSGGGYKNNVYVGFITRVNQTYNIEVLSAVEESSDIPSHYVNMTTDPGSTLIQRVKVTNYANGPDVIFFGVRTSSELYDEGWDGHIGAISNTGDYTPLKEEMDFNTPLKITSKGDPIVYLPDNTSADRRNVVFWLDTGESAWIQVTMSAPRTALDTDEVAFEIFAVSEAMVTKKTYDEPYDAGEYDDVAKYIEAEFGTDVFGDPYKTSSEAEEDNSVVVDIEIKLSDLTFTESMSYPSGMEEGKIYSVQAKIENKGDIEANDFWVTFYVDDDEIDKVYISRLIPGRQQIVSFTWAAEGGSHRFKMVVDPEDNVIESSEKNNEITAGKGGDENKAVTVTEEEDAESQPMRNSANVAALFIVLLILMAIALAYITKKYRDMTKKE